MLKVYRAFMLYYLYMNRPNRATAGVFVAIALAFGAGMYAGVSDRISGIVSAQGLGGVQPANVDFAKFWQAWAILNKNFVETHSSSTVPTDQEKLYGAIKGLTESYGDPYTTFLPPVEAKQFVENINGEFSGVGMELGMKEGAITVIAPLKDSPAQRAGILPGDIVVMVDATSTVGMSTDDAVKIIRGPKGTTVKLTLTREGKEEPVVVSIVRDTINIPLRRVSTLSSCTASLRTPRASSRQSCASLCSRAATSLCSTCAATRAAT
jgi:carboxyl-terminal processing protease